MSIDGDIRARLTGNAAVATLFGTRIYAERPPENVAVPYVTYNQVSRRAIGDHSGSSFGPRRWQFDVWAYTYADSFDGAEAIESALKGWQAATVAGEIDIPEPATTSPARYHRALDMFIWAADPQPA